MRMASESADISIESSGDQERRVNIYGSFVADEELMADVEVEAAEAEVRIDARFTFSGNSLRKSPFYQHSRLFHLNNAPIAGARERNLSV